MIWTSGTVYEGDFADDKISGQGKKTFSDGKTQKGTWDNGELVPKK